ncbi:MAG: DUF4019 domain-containing protein [Dongiaceae bacterium]
MKHWIFAVTMLALIGLHSAVFAATLEFAPGVGTEINVTTESTPGWIPTPEQQQKALRTVEALLDALDEIRYADAYEMYDQGMKQLQTLNQFIELEERIRAMSGPAELWRVLKVTWSKNPVSAPIPGIYAAIDLTVLFEKTDRYCGYVILHQKIDDSDFVVMRREYNLLDNATAQAIEAQHSKEKLEQVWAQLTQACPNYAPIAKTQ